MNNEQREQQMMDAAEAYAEEVGYKDENDLCATLNVFCAGWRAADSHPQWFDAQGDNVPEYGREVIVIGRDGKVFYGHRPDPKEVTMVEGKPYHAKTYDKNGWNWPNIALWLDVEIPNELVEQITDKWFEENEQRRTKSKSSTCLYPKR